MLVGLFITMVYVYWDLLQKQCLGLMLETTLQTFRGSAVFTVKIVDAFKMDTHIAQKRASST